MREVGAIKKRVFGRQVRPNTPPLLELIYNLFISSYNIKMKKILFIIATHGDEKIGLEVIERLKLKKLNRFFDCLIASPRALRKNARFIDVDLNRSYPGAKNSKLYEKKRAYENLQKAKKYQYVVDIHEASQGINNFIIAPRERLPKLFPINLINLKTILLWPNPKGSLSQILENAIELEFGMKNKKREKVIRVAGNIIEKFIKNIYQKKKEKKKQKLYYVYGNLTGKEFSDKKRKLRDFCRTKINGETFYPLLVGQYLRDGIICYKMKPYKF